MASFLGQCHVAVVKPHLTLLDFNLEIFVNLSTSICWVITRLCGCEMEMGCGLTG